jgi:hypothetical protein
MIRKQKQNLKQKKSIFFKNTFKIQKQACSWEGKSNKIETSMN